MTELSELARRALAELELEMERAGPPGPHAPDLVVTEMFTGECRRELAAARDDLARTRDRYQAAILKARAAGFSWGEIGSRYGAVTT
ncbi:hypothetical protein [Mycolicibacterium mengxianglii]|uniref:hypothetical protein n=1 Tax=Mycolicibacterium mengxianglii TaxID=2736649 RepID=UPI0018D0C3A0|nr:hypothetical protein [Mycolicibacterium mengxianglii]